jgi:hypothetical protein
LVHALGVLAALALSAGNPASPPDLRLPGNARPVRQAIELSIDPSLETFSGSVAIELEIQEPSSVLWLNATGLEAVDQCVALKGSQEAGLAAYLREHVTELTAGRKEARELLTGDTHVYGLAAEKEQFVHGEAFQSGVDVVVTVTDPDGSTVGAFDSSARGPEYLHFETNKAGLYRISVTPFEDEEGEYSVRILRQEPLADTPEGKVDQMMAPYGAETPGGVVAVVRGGEIDFSAGYGLANVEYGVPNSISTPYYTVFLEDEELMIGHRRHGEFALSPREEDVFASREWYIGKVKFDRDEGGNIRSMRMGGGRVRALRFERVDSPSER